MLEATALPTEPQPLPFNLLFALFDLLIMMRIICYSLLWRQMPPRISFSFSRILIPEKETSEQRFTSRSRRDETTADAKANAIASVSGTVDFLLK